MKKNNHRQVAFLKEHISESIRKARIKKNISRQERALALNVERSTVSCRKTGKRIPDVKMLGQLDIETVMISRPEVCRELLKKLRYPFLTGGEES